MKTASRIAQTIGLILIWLIGGTLMPIFMLPGLWDGVREVWKSEATQ